LAHTRYLLDGTAEIVMDPLRLLRATGTFVLPTHNTIRLLATAEDVTHS
jgi:heme/copper-type cytochrome/quinol oxidase subunit 2